MCSIANTALQRTMGTVAGGVIGYLVRCLGDWVHTRFLAAMYAATAAAIGGLGIWLGEILGGPDVGMWSTTTKLSVTTFLLVFADGKDPVRSHATSTHEPLQSRCRLPGTSVFACVAAVVIVRGWAGSPTHARACSRARLYSCSRAQRAS